MLLLLLVQGLGGSLQRVDILLSSLNKGNKLAAFHSIIATLKQYCNGMQALAVVRHLLQGHRSDEHVVQALGNLLETPAEQHADIMGLSKCTGMKQESAGMIHSLQGYAETNTHLWHWCSQACPSSNSTDRVVCVQVAGVAGMKDIGRVGYRTTPSAIPAQAAQAMMRAGAKNGCTSRANAHFTASASSALL